MPQIAQLHDTLAGQIFWALIFFGFVFFVIGRGMVPKVMATVEARDSQIAADLAAAQAARTAADAEELAWQQQAARQREEVHALIAKAKADAARATEARLAEANAATDLRLAEADTRIATARGNALAEIETVAVEATQDIVARVSGTSIDTAGAAAAVKEALHG